MTAFSAAPAPPPSRHDNPFATCWTHPGAMPFLPTDDASTQAVISEWRDANHCGQIVGPHGVGKSTLLASIGESLEATGWQINTVVFRSDKKPSTTIDFPRHATGSPTAWLVDGLEQLSPWSRRRLLRQRRAANAAMIATTHHPLRRLPVLATLAPSLPLVLRLLHRLKSKHPTGVTDSMAAEAFAQSRGNLRETWFALYDQHEALQARSQAALESAP